MTLVFSCLLISALSAQEPVRLRSAVVVLTEDAELRKYTEDLLVAKARENRYDAVVSYDLVPNVRDLDRRSFLRTLGEQGIQAVLMLRPSAIGAGSSLESVRNQVSPETLQRMRDFARDISDTSTDDLVAVIHLAIYSIIGGQAVLMSSGAVWLDEEVTDQLEGIDRLLDLVAANVNRVRPALRRHLGLPPLP
jgi:hypothetical protein